MGTALERAPAQTDLALKAPAYGIPAWAVDGMDVLAVEDAARAAAGALRIGGGPYFLELRTYRFRVHAMYGPDRYRDRQEIEAWKARDPLGLLSARLRDVGALDDALQGAIEAEVAAEVDDAVAYAEAGHLEELAVLERFTYRGAEDDGATAGGPATSRAGAER